MAWVIGVSSVLTRGEAHINNKEGNQYLEIRTRMVCFRN